MIFLDVLLSLNLVLFGIWALRAPRRPRPTIDDLVAAAVDRAPVHEGGAVVIAFPTPDELDRRRARLHHPSMYGVSLGQSSPAGRFSSRP